VIIDYAQLIDSHNKRDNRSTVVSEISRTLKIVAKENDLLIIAAAQLNRGTENRKDTTPRLSDFRESGGLEQDADVAWLLHCLNEEETSSKRDYQLIVAKNRNGPKGVTAITYDGPTFKFSEEDSRGW
jgi:replicative DNA helicase